MKKINILIVVLLLDLFIISVSALDVCRYDNGDSYVEDRIFYLMDNYGQQGLPIIGALLGTDDECINKVISSSDSIMVLDVAKICTINPIRNGRDALNKYNVLISSGYYSSDADITKCSFPDGYNVTLQNAKQDWINDFCRHNRINITNECLDRLAFEKKNRGVKPTDAFIIAFVVGCVVALVIYFDIIMKIRKETRFRLKK